MGLKSGVNHVGLGSTDYEGTVDFYTRVVGWEIAWQDQAYFPDGREMFRHVFFDIGDGTMVAFMCSVPDSPVMPQEFATDINSGLGLMAAVYHFAFSLESEEALEQKRKDMEARGAEVSCYMNHGWCKSFYFRDPVNDLVMEYTAQLREFNDDDKELKARPQAGLETTDPAEMERSARIMGLPLAAVPPAA